MSGLDRAATALAMTAALVGLLAATYAALTTPTIINGLEVIVIPACLVALLVGSLALGNTR